MRKSRHTVEELICVLNRPCIRSCRFNERPTLVERKPNQPRRESNKWLKGVHGARHITVQLGQRRIDRAIKSQRVRDRYFDRILAKLYKWSNHV